ncbi:sugar ABC transporter ATP-binding protein [Sorangium sp. So ce131]|uniref:sugar ABC transporter ATP-binding protein n=1 Tax=Sorangium sp. So ce131 TaxID=3133282 RepID=UPI003F5D567B
MASADYVLEMIDISKQFPGVKALDSVSLRVRPGTVHALMGENGAGKSTLMKCLFGMYAPDAGAITLAGKAVSFSSSRDALDHGIAMIHQELQPIPYRSVMENVWLGRYPVRGFGPFKLVDHKKMLEDTRALFKELRMDIDPTTWVVNLSVSKIQSMEIAKAVSQRAKIIIMDEPTSSLTEHEVEHLFEIIGNLRREGVAIIYISHKMEEILRISDEVTIMRDGRVVGTYPSSELTTDLIIQRMVGRDMTQRFPPRENEPGEVVLRVEGLTSTEPRSFRDVSFDLRKGEILGVSGLVGAQRTELMEALFGLRGIARGRVVIGQEEARIRDPIKAIDRGMALLTEERRSTGIFPMLDVADNTLSASWKKYKRKTGLLDRGRAEKEVRRLVEALRVKTPSTRAFIQNLSGGNQQKVIVARWLLTSPDILILDEPTRGVDVGAKYEIYAIIADLAKRGKSIIMISSELPEVLGMSDRIMVMCGGRITGILEGKRATQEEIMALSTQFM